jgi:hypothetical protein
MNSINDLTTDLNNWAITLRLKAEEADAQVKDLEQKAEDPRNWPMRGFFQRQAEAERVKAASFRLHQAAALQGVLLVDNQPTVPVKRLPEWGALHAAAVKAGRVFYAKASAGEPDAPNPGRTNWDKPAFNNPTASTERGV